MNHGGEFVNECLEKTVNKHNNNPKINLNHVIKTLVFMHQYLRV